MGHWAIDTPIEALENAILSCWLFDKYMRRRGRSGMPGEVIADMRGEPRRLIGKLRSEHMLSLRDDVVRPFIDAPVESARELWRLWRQQMSQKKKRRDTVP